MRKARRENSKKIASLLWISSIQYFIVQIIADLRSSVPYSILSNTISDLGNTECGAYSDRVVCSPSHILMNLSIILLGGTMMAGALILYKLNKRDTPLGIGLLGLVISGFGTILVGIFPENVSPAIHGFGAALPFLIGNVSLVLISLSMEKGSLLKTYTLFSGVIALIGLVLFLSESYLGLGIGGMERIVAYPQTIWLIIYGLITYQRIKMY